MTSLQFPLLFNDSIRLPALADGPGNIEGGIDYRDRGLAYGDGVFETMYCVAGEIPLWSYHDERLQRGLKHLGIAIDAARLEKHCAAVLECLVNCDKPLVVKLLITRGLAGRGYLAVESKPSLITIVSELKSNKALEQGIKLHVCQERLAEPISWAGLKTLNQLSYVLASNERHNLSVDEGVLLSASGKLIEATARNIFCVIEGQLWTPDLSRCGVAGVMRQAIIDIIAPSLDLSVHIGDVSLSILNKADEVFLCNGITGIWPVLSCQDFLHQQEWHWATGRITRQLQQMSNKLFNLQYRT